MNDIIFFVDVIKYGFTALIIALVILNTISQFKKLKNINKIFKNEESRNKTC